jgi:hypothetical protein
LPGHLDNLKLLGVRKLACAFAVHAFFVSGSPLRFFLKTGTPKAAARRRSKPINGAGFQPLSFLLLHSWGFAPGWSLAISGWSRCTRTSIILQFFDLFLDNPVLVL